MKKRIPLWIVPACFLGLVIVLDLWSCAASLRPLEKAVKPLLLALTALTSAVFLLEKDRVERRTVWLLMTAQLFGCAGDTLLMGSGLPYFGCGMAAFLVGHICYLTLFGRTAWKGLPTKVWILSVLLMLALLAVLVVAIGVKGVLLVPMLVYGLVLMLLVFCGICGLVRLRGAHWGLILCGGLLFLFSDGLIAMRTFGLENTPMLGFTIMLTYIAAQGLLAIGACRAPSLSEPSGYSMTGRIGCP